MAVKFPMFVQLKAIDNVSKTLDKVSGRMNRFGKQMTGIGKRISMNISAPAALAGVGMFRAAANFEEAFKKVQALRFDATKEELASLEKKAMELGRSTRFTATEVAQGMGFLAQAGQTAEQMLGSIEPALQLATVAEMDMAEAADIVTNVLSGFGQEAKDLGDVNDQLAKTIVSSNTNLQELAEGMKMVAPVARNYGLSVSEVAAAMGVLGSSGIKGEMAGTGLARVIETLIAKGAKITSFKDLIRALGKEANGAQLILETFGKRGGRNLLSLVNAGEEEFDSLLNKILDSEGTAKTIAEIMDQGAKGSIRRLGAALEGLSISIGRSGILTTITNMIERLALFIQALAKANPTFLKIVGYGIAFLAVLGPIITTLGLLTIAIAAIATPIGLTVAAVVGGLAAIGAAIGLIGAWYIHVTQNMEEFWNSFFDRIHAAIDAVKDFGKRIYSSIVGAFTKVGDFISDLIPNALKRAWNAVPNFIKRFLDLPKFDFNIGDGAGSNQRPVIPSMSERGILETRTTRVEKQEASVKVTFDNLPPGATVRPEGRPEIPLRLDTGYSMAY